MNCCSTLDFMLYKLDYLPQRAGSFVPALTLVFASLLTFMSPLQAEPVVQGLTQPTNRLIDARQWLPGTHNPPLNTTDPDATPSVPQNTPAAPARPAGETSSALAPAADRSQRTTQAMTNPSSPIAPTHAAAPKVAEDTSGRDIQSAVKDVVRPLYKDLATSDAAQALRSLQSDLNLDKEQAFNAPEANQTSRQEGSGLPRQTATWEGQANQEPPRSAAQVERDKIQASVMMDKLIDSVMPWAIGLVALYALFYLVKLGMAYGRHRSLRRRQIRGRRSRQKTSV